MSEAVEKKREARTVKNVPASRLLLILDTTL